MADLMEKGAAWLASQHACEYSSRAVTYSRGLESVSLRAAIGRTVFQVETQFGIERVESRDFLVKASELILSGAPVLPQAGDRITEADAAAIYTYEVAAPAQEPVYSMDRYRQQLRVHTKLIARQ